MTSEKRHNSCPFKVIAKIKQPLYLPMPHVAKTLFFPSKEATETTNSRKLNNTHFIL